MEGSFALNPTRPVTASARSHINRQTDREITLDGERPAVVLAGYDLLILAPI